ncbi:DUF5522 domain-containing protein [Euzebya sp.]|uniref:DUF5522 domain-containing protein n=1 Tax=Euzebya sp. TaxID=1971409 RepID=UPI0035115981
MGHDDLEELARAGRPLPDALVDPHPERVPAVAADQVLAVHRAAVADGAEGYVDPVSGLLCFTALHHWRRGRCCGLGCRHCPWVDAAGRLGGR